MAGGKKKRAHPDLDELLARPYCYYCERDFDDLKILISHQKAKHFKCERCGRRLNTAGGLSVHMNQVHKETLTIVENALGNRSSLDVEIFGMEGIPEDVTQAHNQRIITQFYQAEAERRAATGNPTPGGGGGGGQSKRPKFESPTELKKRLAEHKARMADQTTGGDGSGGNTPGSAQSPPLAQSPGAFDGSSYAPPQVPFGGPQGANYGSISQESFAPATIAYQQPYSQQPGYSPSGAQYPPNQPQFSQAPQYNQQQFPATTFQQAPNFPAAPQQFGAGAPPGNYSSYQPPAHANAQHGLPSRPSGLPQPPGLPQRPSFAAPPLPQYQAQQGQGPPQHGVWTGNGWSGADHQNPAMLSAYPPHSHSYNPANASSVDDLISGATRAPDDIDEIIRMAEAGIRPVKKFETQSVPSQGLVPVPVLPAVSEPPAVQEASEKQAVDKSEATEKKAKKEKDKNAKMIYSDNEISPEEKMAKMPRYAFVPDGN